MPEGPEVKTVARTLAEQLVGKELGQLWHSHHQLRRPVDYSQLQRHEAQTISDVYCYGKILFIDTTAPALMAQLGMTGQLTVEQVTAPLAPHTHVRWRLRHCELELRYVDPRRFGLIDVCDDEAQRAIIARLGPDPFLMTANDFGKLASTMKRSIRPIKEILLDQTVVVGVGNIYASEALFLARISPLRRGADIGDEEYQRLLPAIIEVLKLAYANSGTTFSSYVDGTGKRGDNLAFLKVFQRDKQPCGVCQTPITRVKQGGRSTFFCQTCQN